MPKKTIRGAAVSSLQGSVRRTGKEHAHRAGLLYDRARASSPTKLSTAGGRKAGRRTRPSDPSCWDRRASNKPERRARHIHHRRGLPYLSRPSMRSHLADASRPRGKLHPAHHVTFLALPAGPAIAWPPWGLVDITDPTSAPRRRLPLLAQKRVRHALLANLLARA